MGKEKKSRGRPSLFTETVRAQILRMYEKGFTDQDVADVFDVDVTTIDNWKKKDFNFLGSIKEAKILADKLVETSLFHKARGYSHEEEKIFCNADGQVTKVTTIKHYAPDVTAQIFWLKNRQPKDWREKHDVELTSSVIQIKIDSEDSKL